MYSPLVVCGLLIFALFILLLFLYRKDSLIIYNTESQFGKKKSGHDAKIVEQKLLHKNIAFIAFLCALTISFFLGIWIVIEAANGNLSQDMYSKGVEIMGGGAVSVGFGKLYSKCREDVNKLK